MRVRRGDSGKPKERSPFKISALRQAASRVARIYTRRGVRGCQEVRTRLHSDWDKLPTY